MLTYAVRKLLVSVLVLLLASMVIFGLVRLAGDPLAQLRQNPRVDGDDIERISAIYGLDEPVTVQYVIWMRDIITKGDLGTSFAQNDSVNEIVGRRVWPTVLLMSTSLVFAVTVAVPFGVYSAIKKYSTADKLGTFVSFLGFSVPSFFLGLMLQLVLGIYLTNLVGTRVFYTSGMTSPGGGFVDLLQHLVLPVLTLSAISIASYSRFQRSAMLDVLSSEYLRTARAKGLSRRRVYLKHALRNALIPVVTLLALDIAAIFGGAVVTETVFAWPGLGFLLVDSISKGDYNVARALLLISAALVVLFNLVADLVYGLIDPRVSFD